MSETDHISDERLTAFLDGVLSAADAQVVAEAVEADPALAARLAALDLPMDQFRAALAPARMGAPGMPATLLAANDPAPPRRRFWIPLAIAAAFVAGVALPPLVPEQTQPVKWVDAVASYQALYVTQTLDAPRQPGAQTQEVLASAATAFDVTLDPALEIDGLDFKRAQMLGWNGKPLLQIAYLTPDGTPMALCLTRVGAEDRGPQSGISHNLAGVNWVANGVGYYLVGGTDIAEVEALSRSVIARL